MMNNNYWKIFLLVYFNLNYSSGESECQIKIFGTETYVGSVLKTWKDRSFCGFRGIRYAQPPVGELRFKDPRPFRPNMTEVDASNDKNDCPSIYAKNSSEDCLYLNIYSKIENDVRKPVVVIIHPGGLYLGSSLSNVIGPEYLMDKDIVVVSFNYRLGTLGFLNLGTEEIPGNAGFKDQVMALRWVKNNIEYFGGNPNDVTLVGYSAGGLSISLHLVSPMSVGLFQKAVIMSGSIPPQTIIPANHQFLLAQKQANVLGCTEINNATKVVECLNKFTGKEIAATLRQMFDFGHDNPIFLWLPIIEKDYGHERFLTENPHDSFKSGNFMKVPILTGFTDKELCVSAIDMLKSKSLNATFWASLNTLAPICFMYQKHPNRFNITKSLQDHYFNSNMTDYETFEKLCNLFSDSVIRFGIHRLAEIASNYVDVYTYKFSYSGDRYKNLIYADRPIQGAFHMDDFMYLIKDDSNKFSKNDPEARVVDQMVEFFTHFAVTGKPNSKFDVTFNDRKYYEISNKLEMNEGRNFDEANFWDALIPNNYFL